MWYGFRSLLNAVLLLQVFIFYVILISDSKESCLIGHFLFVYNMYNPNDKIQYPIYKKNVLPKHMYTKCIVYVYVLKIASFFSHF